jgi:signal transduction histidine kinase
MMLEDSGSLGLFPKKREAQMAQEGPGKEAVLEEHRAPSRAHIVGDVLTRNGLEQSFWEKEALIRELVQDRARISHDLHDGVLQSIYAIGIGLQTCKILLQESPEKASDHLEHVIDQLDRTIHEVRGFVKTGLGHNSSSSGRFDRELSALVRGMAETAGVSCRLMIDPEACASLAFESQKEIVPIMREAVSNSLRHGHPRHLAVSMQREKGSVRLIVADDGIGFHATHPPRDGCGLRNLTMRAAKLGARLRVRSRPCQGTQVILDVPL